MKTVTDIEKMGKIVRRLKWIDSEIIRLEKVAMKVVEGTSKVSIDLTIISDKPEANKDVVCDESGYDGTKGLSYFFQLYNSTPKPEANKDVDTFEVREEMAYRMFDMYLKGLVLDRQALIIQLEQFGVNI
jgi:hypothetical protein